MSIRPLPEDVSAQIRSSATITTLNDAIFGLVKNSLDAGASRITISLDYARGNCTVDDNGEGIAPAEFKETGGLCKFHCTSRWPPDAAHHGSRGTFLASLAQFSLTTISSRHQDYGSHNALSLHYSAPPTRHVPAPQSLAYLAFDHGTRVQVRDLFGSMPVRVKQRNLLSLDGDAISSTGEWNRLVRMLAVIVLAWTENVEIRLRNESRRAEARLGGGAGTRRFWEDRVGLVMVQAGLVGRLEGWVGVAGAVGRVALEGAICRYPSANKRGQSISVGVSPLPDGFGQRKLAECVNNVFANSDFGCLPCASPASARGEHLARKAERWPLFFLRVSSASPNASPRALWCDLANGQGNEFVDLGKLLTMICTEFLKKHGFNIGPLRTITPAKARSRKGHLQRSLRNSPSMTSRTLSPFAPWQRTKTGQPEPEPSEKTTAKPQPRPAKPSTTKKLDLGPLVSRNGELLRSPFDHLELRDGPGHKPRKRRHEEMDDEPGATAQAPRPSTSVEEITRNWKNPVFTPPEPCIPRISAANTGGNAHGPSLTVTSKVSREALAQARVVAQVDRKFILIKLRLGQVSKGDECLVLVDQHAADERIRLEHLMGEYFTKDHSGNSVAATEPLERPILFSATTPELSQLPLARARLRRWGLRCEPDLDARQCHVTHLPPSIRERCLEEPKLAIDLVREELWIPTRRVAETDISTDHSAVTRRFYDCPRGIMELLNSRACRTALMFNDVLCRDDCVDLIRRLAKCALPFQCAHGRPVLAPIVGLSQLEPSGPERRDDLRSWLGDM